MCRLYAVALLIFYHNKHEDSVWLCDNDYDAKEKKKLSSFIILLWSPMHMQSASDQSTLEVNDAKSQMEEVKIHLRYAVSKLCLVTVR